MLRSRMWAANSLLYPHFRPLVFSSSFFSSFSSTSNLISVTWSTLASSLRFHFFVLFFFLCVSWLEYPGIYYFRLLSLSPNFTLCSSFLGPYLDPASSTLLAPLAYTLFLLRLRSWFCYPRSFAFLRIERSSPLLVFLSLLIFIISPHRSCSLNTVFLCTILALFALLLFPYLSQYLLYHHVLALLWTLSLSQCIYSALFFFICSLS